jgi:hypothetical protein
MSPCQNAPAAFPVCQHSSQQIARELLPFRKRESSISHGRGVPVASGAAGPVAAIGGVAKPVAAIGDDGDEGPVARGTARPGGGAAGEAAGAEGAAGDAADANSAGADRPRSGIQTC